MQAVALAEHQYGKSIKEVGIVTEWHTWDEVNAELSDLLGSAEEREQRVEQLRRELVAVAAGRAAQAGRPVPSRLPGRLATDPNSGT